MAPGKLLFETVRLELLVKADNPLNGPFLNRG
jgi:hypothetical protein